MQIGNGHNRSYFELLYQNRRCSFVCLRRYPSQKGEVSLGAVEGGRLVKLPQ